VTVSVTAPAAPAGVVAVIVVLFTTATLVAAAVPNVTVAPVAKFVPVIVTAVPPPVDPLPGLTLLTVGGAPDVVGAKEAMITPELSVPLENVVMLTFPDGETGDPLLAKIPPPPYVLSMTIGLAPGPATKFASDQIPCTTNDPVALVVSDVVRDVLVAAAVFVVDASGWADCCTLYHDAAWERRECWVFAVTTTLLEPLAGLRR
jgi:hypothetical protein